MRINAVRCAIGDSGTEQRLIKTLPRKGVRFVGEVREERKPSEALSANSPQRSAVQPIDVRRTIAGLPAPQALSPVIPASRGSRRFFASRAMLASIAATGVLCLGALAWSHFALSAQSERTRANIETAARLIGISETINMTSREDYEAARALRQWRSTSILIMRKLWQI